MFGIVEPMKLDGMPRCIKWQASDCKRKLECEDILNLFGLTDTAQCIMPKFVAADLQRVPTISPGDVDVYAMTSNVATELERQSAASKEYHNLGPARIS